MKTTMEVEAIKHADIRGKELTYIKITKGDKSAIINVGEKTYKAVQELEVENVTTIRMRNEEERIEEGIKMENEKTSRNKK